jgi:acyl-CoA hydrolase
MPENTSRYPLLILLTAVFLISTACGRQVPVTAVPQGQTVLAFGDSITFGTGAGPGEDWPTLLEPATGWYVVNAGIPGDTTFAGKSRFPDLLARYRPALVIIEMGGNDFLRRRPQRDVKEDLRYLIRAARQAGSQVLLIAVPELSLMAVIAGKPDDSPIYAELGQEEDVPVITDVLSEVLSSPELCADNIHPNAAGYRKMADEMYRGMKELGLILETKP